MNDGPHDSPAADASTAAENDRGAATARPRAGAFPSARRFQRRSPGSTRGDATGTFPYETVTIRLNHMVVAAAFDRYYDRYRESFYHVTAVLQKLDMTDGLELVHRYLESVLNDARTTLVDGKAQLLEAIQKQTGQQAYRTRCSRPAERDAKVPSYLVRQYLNLYTMTDDYLDVVVYAETVGAIPWSQRRLLFTNSPRYVTTAAGRFQSLATRISLRELEVADSAMNVLNAVLDAVQGHPKPSETRPLTVTPTEGSGQTTEVVEEEPRVPPPAPVLDDEDLAEEAEQGVAADVAVAPKRVSRRTPRQVDATAQP